MPTLFRTLAELGEKLESTTKRKDMVKWVASFILQLETEEIEPATSMLMGRAFPKWDQRVLEISWATLSMVLRKITNADNDTFSKAFSKTGDVGDVKNVELESKLRFSESSLQSLKFKEHWKLLQRLRGLVREKKRKGFLKRC